MDDAVEPYLCMTPAEQLAGLLDPNCGVRVGIGEGPKACVVFGVGESIRGMTAGQARLVARDCIAFAAIVDRMNAGWKPTDDELRAEVNKGRK